MSRLRRHAAVLPSPVREPAAAVSGPADVEHQHDERLVRATRQGDLASFNALVVRHERAVYNLCLRLLRDVTAAEDATQETFVRAWTALDTHRVGLFRPWLLRVATNHCYDVLRARPAARRLPRCRAARESAEVDQPDTV
jgi:RNA polymerase sigma-70 factor (ECF subfamily)